MTTPRASEPAGGPPLGGAGRRSPAHLPGGRNLPVAIASGVALAVAFFFTLWLHPYAVITMFQVLVVVALLELDVAFRGRGLQPATPVAIGVSVVLAYGTYARGPQAQALGLVVLIFGALVWTLLQPFGRRSVRVGASLAATCLMTLWVPFFVSYTGLLLAREDGASYLLAAVAFAVVADISAYAAGSKFGRHKLAPSVSPSKTWEGFAGGLFGVVVVAGVIIAQLPGFDLASAVVVGLGVAVAATVGDLSESMVKRDLGVKDLGRIVPGHGGIMDRADAIVFALPATHMLLLALDR